MLPDNSFDLQLHDTFTRIHGDHARWISTTPCPCGPSRDRVNPNCLVCHGEGRIRRSTRDVFGILVDATMDKALVLSGIAQPGDLLFSQSPLEHLEILHEDILVPTEFGTLGGQPYQGERVIRGNGPVDYVKFEIATVDDCLVVNPEYGDLHTFTLGTDFTTSGRAITWTGLNQPTPGQLYTLKYRAYFEYDCYAPPHLRVERASSLGQRVLLRKRAISTEADGQ